MVVRKKAGEVSRFLFIGAPRRAHLLGGKSPLLTQQVEELAERQITGAALGGAPVRAT